MARKLFGVKRRTWRRLGWLPKAVKVDGKRSAYPLATIKKDRVQRQLGRFRDEIAAAQAYDEAARELFAEHARLNFPDGVDASLEREAA